MANQRSAHLRGIPAARRHVGATASLPTYLDKPTTRGADCGGGLDLSRQRCQQPGEREGEGRLAAAVGAGERGGETLGDIERSKSPYRPVGLVADRQVVRGQDSVAGGGRHARYETVADPWHPRAERRELLAMGGEDLLRRAVGDDTTAGGQDDDAVDERQPGLDAVLDDDEGGRPAGDEASDRVPYLLDTGRVEDGRRLVEEQQTGSHRQRTREREPLPLATGQPLGAAVEGEVEADVSEGCTDAGPDLVPGYGEVLQAECHVVADAGEDRLGVGILHHQAGAPRPGPVAVDGQRPGLLTLVGAAEHAGESVQEGRLACAGRPEQQHPLARLEAERDVGDSPGGAAGVAPAPPVE